MREIALLLLLLLVPRMVATAAPACPAGAAVAYFRLEARRPGVSSGVPLDKVNHLQKGDAVVFYPSDPPVPMDVNDARVALMYVTADSSAVKLLPAKKANARQEWTLPDDAAVVAIAYGPRGFDESKMERETAKDPELIAQIAEYGEKSTQTELVLNALTGARTQADRALDGALQGLARSTGGVKLDRDASLDQQTMSLMRALNPALGSLDPLAPEPEQRWQQSAVLASSVAGLFLGNTVALAGGSAALFMNLRSIMFPRTELRSALLRESPEPALCASKQTQSRTRLAYLWARRLPGGQAPALRLTAPGHVAIGQPAALPVDASDPVLDAAGRAFRWTLRDDMTGKSYPLTVTLPVNEKSLRLAPIPEKIPPAVYRLTAMWDWVEVPVDGTVHVHKLPDIKDFRLDPVSADNLITGSGRVRLRITGRELFFINSVQVLRQGDLLARPVSLPFAPGPNGDFLECEIDTGGLPAGPYQLTLTQQGGAKATSMLLVHEALPAIRNLPFALHAGETAEFRIEGDRIQRIEKIQISQGEAFWDASRQTLRITLPKEAPTSADLEIQVESRNQPVRLAGAVKALGPKPQILAVTRAPQQAGSVERRDGEIDAALPASFSLRTANVPAKAEVAVRCKGSGIELPTPEVQRTGADSLFLTLPPTNAPGCELVATVGGSAEAQLGTVVVLPVIERFELSDEPAKVDGAFLGTIRGKGLERIGRTGWSSVASHEVTDLPVPENGGQRLQIVMPWPSPSPRAPLRIWLRGESEPRSTTARY